MLCYPPGGSYGILTLLSSRFEASLRGLSRGETNLCCGRRLGANPAGFSTASALAHSFNRHHEENRAVQRH